MGGSFNYVAWICDCQDNHPFVSVGFHQFQTFWLSLGLLFASTIFTATTFTKAGPNG
jgi:hypothetical protein